MLYADTPFRLLSKDAEEVTNPWVSGVPEPSLVDIEAPASASTSLGDYVNLLDLALVGDTDSLDDIVLEGTSEVDTLTGVPLLSPMLPQIGKDSQGHLCEIIAARFQYAIDEIKRTPSTMVLESRTPWYHPQLFKGQVPRSILDAHSACALYMAKNTCNAQDIVRSIQARVEDLLTAPTPTTSQEILARVQSLLLYQIIQVFDADFHVFMVVEKAALALEDATMLLMSQLNSGKLSSAPQYTDKEVLHLFSIEQTRPLWMSWVLAESARRTLLTALFFIQLHRLLSGTLPFSCDGEVHTRNSWTLSAHLWNAENLFDFTVAWRSKSHFVIRNGVFSQVIRDAEADDIEVFGRMLFTLFMGIDETKIWFASRGGIL